MRLSKITVLVLVCAVVLIGGHIRAADYYPSDTRFGDFEANVRQGIVGGIPTRSGGTQIQVTDHGWDAANTAAQNTTALQAALAASSEGDVIHIPGYTAAFNGIALNRNHKNRTIRGAGSGSTVLVLPSGVQAFFLGSDTNLGNIDNPQGVVTAMTRGSTTITVDDGAASYGGGRQLSLITLKNELVTPVFSTREPQDLRSFPVVVTGRSGNNLTLSQPLPSSYAASLAEGGARIEAVFQLDWNTVGIGIEGIYFDCSSHSPSTPTFSAQISYAENCWLKDVKIYSEANYALFANLAVNLEITESIIIGITGGTNRSGLLVQNLSNCLFEDSFYEGGPAIEHFGGVTNCVFAFNYLNGVLYGNHAPWSSYNLYEGNTWAYFISDGYFGGSSEDTLFRNWVRSEVTASLKRFTRNYNMVGNLVGVVGASYASDYSERWGDPNIGNENSYGDPVQFSTGDFWPDWDSANDRPFRFEGTLTTRTSGTAGVITLTNSGDGAVLASKIAANGGANIRSGFGHLFITITDITGDVVTFTTGSHTSIAEDEVDFIYPGPPSFQQQDLDVAASTIRKGGWYVYHGGIRTGEELDVGETLPASYFRSSKPAYFGDLPWPAYDPLSPGTPDGERIPAGYRYINGNRDYLGGVSTPQFSPSPGTYGSAQTVTITSATPDAVIYYTINGTDPTTSSTLYSGPVTLPGTTTTLKALGTKSGMDDSSIQVGVYVVGSVPDAPSALNATAVSSSQINLTWTDNSDDETSFRIERRIGEGSWTSIATPAANATSYNNTGLTASTTYEYRVYAVNAAGDSTASGTDSATTDAEAGPGGETNLHINGILSIDTLIIQ